MGEEKIATQTKGLLAMTGFVSSINNPVCSKLLLRNFPAICQNKESRHHSVVVATLVLTVNG